MEYERGNDLYLERKLIMDRLKAFAKYAIWVILFWILSDILIYLGINSTYKDKEQRGEIPEGIEIVQMQSTKVNGRVTVKVTDNQMREKFLKIDLYSSTGVNLGTQYIALNSANENNEIETYFKISDVKSYEVSVVDEMGESSEGFMDTALSTLTILGILIKFFVI